MVPKTRPPFVQKLFCCRDHFKSLNIAETLDAWHLFLFFAAPWNNILLLPHPSVGPNDIWIRSKKILTLIKLTFESLNIAETLDAWLLFLFFAAPWNNILLLPCPSIGQNRLGIRSGILVQIIWNVAKIDFSLRLSWKATKASKY